ncbi:hypothetical protein J7M23_10875, partial [Candidatus Sumerlaeota bacterium]|nr:hypothetical protein [Candidatus Sumerlaeota bacterium]
MKLTKSTFIGVFLAISSISLAVEIVILDFSLWEPSNPNMSWEFYTSSKEYELNYTTATIIRWKGISGDDGMFCAHYYFPYSLSTEPFILEFTLARYAPLIPIDFQISVRDTTTQKWYRLHLTQKYATLGSTWTYLDNNHMQILPADGSTKTLSYVLSEFSGIPSSFDAFAMDSSDAEETGTDWIDTWVGVKIVRVRVLAKHPYIDVSANSLPATGTDLWGRYGPLAYASFLLFTDSPIPFRIYWGGRYKDITLESGFHTFPLAFAPPQSTHLRVVNTSDSTTLLENDFSPQERKIEEVFGVPFTHADLAWLGRYSEVSVRYANQIKQVIEWIEEMGDKGGYLIEHMHNVKKFKELYPDMVSRLVKYLNTENIEIGGAWTLITDNIFPGEMVLRNRVYAIHWAEENLGWRPKNYIANDVPGQTPQVAQILSKLGLEGFIYQRGCTPSGSPYPFFLFQAPEGSKVATRVGGVYSGGEAIDYLVNGWGKDTLEWFRNFLSTVDGYTVDFPYLLCSASRGDGALPNVAGMTEFAEGWNQLVDKPKLNICPPQKYLSLLREKINNGEVHPMSGSGEIPSMWQHVVVGWQNCFNRIYKACEALKGAEKFASFASLILGFDYPEGELDEQWEKLLQMEHNWGNIGAEENDPLRIQWAEEALQSGLNTMSDAITSLSERICWTGSGVPLTVFNPLNWEVNVPMNVKGQGLIRDAEGDSVNCEDNGDGTITFLASLPPLGYATFGLDTSSNCESLISTPVLTVSNEFYTIRVNGGRLELYDKARGVKLGNIRLWCGKGGWIPGMENDFLNNIQFPAEGEWLDLQNPGAFVSSWDNQIICYSGWDGSAFKLQTRLIKGVNRIFLNLTLHWQTQETHVMPVLVFEPVDVKSITYGQPFYFTQMESDTMCHTYPSRVFCRWLYCQQEDSGTGLYIAGNNHYLLRRDYTLLFVLLSTPGTYSGDPYCTGGYEFKFQFKATSGFNFTEAEMLGLENETPFLLTKDVKRKSPILPHSATFFDFSNPSVIINTVRKREGKYFVRYYNA